MELYVLGALCPSKSTLGILVVGWKSENTVGEVGRVGRLVEDTKERQFLNPRKHSIHKRNAVFVAEEAR